MSRTVEPLLSVAALWRDTLAAARDDAGLLIPLAAAFLFLPQLAFALLAGGAQGQNPTASLGTLAIAAIGLVGQAAMVLVVLDRAERRSRPLGAALRQALAAVPRLLGATLAIALPLGLAAAVIGGLLSTVLARPAALGLTAFALLPALLWLIPRGALLTPAIVEERLGVRAGLARVVALARGRGLRIGVFLLLILIFFVVAILMTGIVVAATGSLATIAFGAAAGKLIAAIGTALVGAIGGVYLTVSNAVLFRHAKLALV